jgi:alpha-maltose-1-phosphate synthase
LLNDVDRQFAIAQRWKNADAIDVVPHGVSSRFLAEAPTGHEPRGRGLLFCGSWTEVKGVTYLVQAYTRLLADGVRAPLTILGGGVSEPTIRAAFPTESQSLLTVLARAPEDVVMAAYREHDVLVWPSTYEGFGMVLIEAMSQRLPVVATPVGCAASLIRSGESGLLVTPRDALTRMLGDRGLRAQCADGAAAIVGSMSWTTTARRTLEVYERARSGALIGMAA